MKLSKRAQLDSPEWGEIGRRLLAEREKVLGGIYDILRTHYLEYQEAESDKKKQGVIESCQWSLKFQSEQRGQSPINISPDELEWLFKSDKQLFEFREERIIEDIATEVAVLSDLGSFPETLNYFRDLVQKKYGSTILQKLEEYYLKDAVIKVTESTKFPLRRQLEVLVFRNRVMIYVTLHPECILELAEDDPGIVHFLSISLSHELGHLIGYLRIPPRIYEAPTGEVSSSKYREHPAEHQADIYSLTSYGIKLHNEGKTLQEIYISIKDYLTRELLLSLDESTLLARRVMKEIMKYTGTEEISKKQLSKRGIISIGWPTVVNLMKGKGQVGPWAVSAVFPDLWSEVLQFLRRSRKVVTPEEDPLVVLMYNPDRTDLALHGRADPELNGVILLFGSRTMSSGRNFYQSFLEEYPDVLDQVESVLTHELIHLLQMQPQAFPESFHGRSQEMRETKLQPGQEQYARIPEEQHAIYSEISLRAMELVRSGYDPQTIIKNLRIEFAPKVRGLSPQHLETLIKSVLRRVYRQAQLRGHKNITYE